MLQICGILEMVTFGCVLMKPQCESSFFVPNVKNRQYECQVHSVHLKAPNVFN